MSSPAKSLRAESTIVPATQAPGAIAVLHKALDILEVLQTAEAPQSLDEIVAQTGLARSTAHRLLLNLSNRGYIERFTAAKFGLGLKLLALGARVRQRQSLKDIAFPRMLELRNQFRETVNLGKLHGNTVLYIEVVESEHAFRVSPILGVQDPLHATALGKAILSTLPSHQRPALTLTKVTPYTITEPAQFELELELTAARGFALDNEESMEGGRCIGVPILLNGAPIAGLSISGPMARITADRVPEIAAALKAAAAGIAAQLELHVGKY